MIKDYSIVIPTYKECENIEPLVDRIAKAISDKSYEILIVDDYSADGTAELVEKLSADYPVRIISRKTERGLASAVVDGINGTDSPVVVVMDADLQHPPEVLPRLIKALDDDQTGVAVGSRHVPGGGQEDWSLIRKIISKGAIFISHMLLPATRDITDPMSGFFAFKRSVVAGVDLEPKGYKILLEVLMMGNPGKTVEVPFTFQLREAGQSKLDARQQIAYLQHIFSLMKRKGELRRFAKFCLVGLSGVIVNVGLLWLLTEVAGLFYMVSAVIAIEISILTNFILNNHFTFADRGESGIKSFFNRLLKFNAASLVGLVLNASALLVLKEFFGVYYILANLVGIALATLWNYLANNWWTWR